MSDPFAVVGIKPNGDLPDEVRARMAANMADPSKPEGAALSTAFGEVREIEAAPTGSFGVAYAALSMRDLAPAVVAIAGSSYCLGSSGSVQESQWPNQVAFRIRQAHPTQANDGVPCIRDLAGASAAAPLPPGVQFVNAAVGSTHAGNFLTDATSDQLMALHPAVLLTDGGFTNSRANGTPVATAKAQLVSRIAYLKSRVADGHPFKVVLLHFNDRATGDQSQPWRAFGQAMREIAASDPTVVSFLDMSAPFRLAESTGSDPMRLMQRNDTRTGPGTHPSNRGQDIIADLICAEIFRVARPLAIRAANPIAWSERITSDTFSGADTSDVGGRVTDCALGGQPLTWVSNGGSKAGIIGGELASNPGVSSTQTLHLPISESDVMLQVRAKSIPDGPMGLRLRASTTSNNGDDCYELRPSWDIDRGYDASGVISLVRKKAGERSQIIAYARFAPNDVLGLATLGAWIGMFRNGRLVDSAIDYTIPAGLFAGVLCFPTASFRFDDLTIDRIAAIAPVRQYVRSVLTSDGFGGGDAASVAGRTSDAALGGAGKPYQLSPTGHDRLSIVGGVLTRGSTAGTAVVALPDASSSCAVEALFTTLPVTAAPVYLFARRAAMTSGAAQYRVSVSSLGARIEHVAGGTVTPLSDYQPVRAGQVIGVQAFGSTVDLVIDRVVKATASHSGVVAAGLSGVETAAAVFAIDNLVVTNLA